MQSEKLIKKQEKIILKGKLGKQVQHLQKVEEEKTQKLLLHYISSNLLKMTIKFTLIFGFLHPGKKKSITLLFLNASLRSTCCFVKLSLHQLFVKVARNTKLNQTLKNGQTLAKRTQPGPSF
jgi:hypothetical protein